MTTFNPFASLNAQVTKDAAFHSTVRSIMASIDTPSDRPFVQCVRRIDEFASHPDEVPLFRKNDSRPFDAFKRPANRPTSYNKSGAPRKAYAKDMSGDKYGRLTFIKKVIVGKKIKYLTRCDCGTEKLSYPYSIITGEIKSCGCLFRERCKETKKDPHDHPTYKAWRNMKAKAGHKSAHIDRSLRYMPAMVPEWTFFSRFTADMGECEDGNAVLLIDCDRDFTPENCFFGPSNSGYAKAILAYRRIGKNKPTPDPKWVAQMRAKTK